MNHLKKVSWILVLVGGLNWGLVGVTELFHSSRFDLVEWLFVDLLGIPVLASIVYLLVGLAALSAMRQVLQGRQQDDVRIASTRQQRHFALRGGVVVLVYTMNDDTCAKKSTVCKN